ncbi:unannotated protein [freshwater metagenome]|uniref:Unannotated protein n=1 Tax=freshwater metagenome TaxID=449393 RepID=A0A6J6JX62_9ZZZZ
MSEDITSSLNAEFWNELCGTNIATELGLTDGSERSIKLFDDWFFNFYPYLKPFLNRSLVGKDKVLEVGLGFGSVSTYLASGKKSYTGLDIAQTPVAMCSSRLSGLPGEHVAIQGNALNAPFSDSTFDAVVAIGSLHHTGNFDRAISEMVRVTKSGGVVCGMVYSLFSLRNIRSQPKETTKRIVENLRGAARIQAGPKMRWQSDHNQKGEPAPSTEYFSRKALRRILQEFGEVQIVARNLDSPPIPFGIGLKIRKLLIRTKLAKWFGLDLYFVVTIKKA